MKLKIFSHGKIEQGYALIGKTGYLRFKQAFAQSMGFVSGDRWLIGTDADESKAKYIYVLRTKEENQCDGWKMIYQNKSWGLSAKTLINELKITAPLKCRVEVYKDDEYDGFRLVLP